MAESEEELRSLLMKVKEQSEQESAVQGSTRIMQNLIAVLRTLVFTVNEVGRHGGFSAED